MTKRQRVLFRIGGWACLVTSAIHLAGQFAPTPPPANDAESTLQKMLTTYRKDFGAGFSRTTMDFIRGFSFTFSLFLFFAGVLALLIAARPPQDEVLGRRIRAAYAFTMGALLAITAVYFFLPPLVCVIVIFLAFGLSAALEAPRALRD
jgi:hypothetical protein